MARPVQITAPGRVRLAAPGRVAGASAASFATGLAGAPAVAYASVPPPPIVGGPLAALDFYQPMPAHPAYGPPLYNDNIGRIRVTGGTGPFVFSMTANVFNYHIRPDSGVVFAAVLVGTRLGTAPDSLTVTVKDALGDSITRTLPVRKLATDAPAIFLSFVGFEDANAVPNAFFYQRIMAYPLGGDHGAQDVIDYQVGGGAADLFSVQLGALASKYAGSDTPSVPPGTYPLRVTAASAASTLEIDYTLIVAPVPAIGAFRFVPAVVSTSLPPGSVVGTALATTPTNARAWSVTGDGAAFFSVVPATGLVAIKATPPATGPVAFDLTCTDQLAARTETVTIDVQQGITLPPADMTLAVAPGLDNHARGQVVGTPQVSGLVGTPAWAVVFEEYYRGPYDMDPLFAIDPATGLITAPGMLSNWTYKLTVIATDGIRSCRQTFDVPVAWKAGGPTLHVGQGMKALHGDAGFEHLVEVQSMFGLDDLGALAGAQVLVHWNADPNYYAEDNGSLLNGSTLAVQFRHTGGWAGPVRISGVRGPNGERPRVGGTVGAPCGGRDPTGKGFFNMNNGDCVFEDLIVSHTLGGSPNGFEALSGIRKNGDTFGDCTVRRCALLDNDNGLLCGYGPFRIVMDSNEIAHAGTAIDGEGHGPSHGCYVGHCVELIYTNNLAWNCTYGHNLKVRAHASRIEGNRIYDTERGNASCMIDLCSGGQHVVRANRFHKGANAQSPGCVQFCAEYDESPASTDPGTNTLLLDGNEFFLAGLPYNHWGQACALRNYIATSHVDGSLSEVTFSNNRVFNAGHDTLLRESVIGVYGQETTRTVPTNTTMLGSPPALDLSHPGPADPSTPRPGFFQYMRDGGQSYDNFNFVQIDPGADDIRLPAGAAPGTSLGACTAFGGNGFRNAGETDPRVNPFGPGTVWSITQAGQFYQDGNPLPWAPAGRYVIDPQTGALAVGTGPRADAGVDFIKVRATGPTGVACDTRLHIAVTAEP